MSKHPLFLALQRPVYVAFHSIGDEVSAMAAAFAAVAALNALLAWLIFRRWCGGGRAAALISLIYMFSFSVWIMASQYETYVMSSVFVNAFLVLLSGRRGPRAKPPVAWRAIVAVAASLLHAPLLVLGGLSIVRAGLREGRSGLWREAGLSAIVVAGYFAGTMALRAAYGPPVEWANSPPATGFLVAEWQIYKRYARAEFRTVFQAGNVVAGQFIYAFSGLPYPSRWSDGLGGARRFFDTVSGGLAACVLAVGWGAALLGLALSRETLTLVLWLFIAVLLPYLAFFWLFNAPEMLLYAAPLVAPILAVAYRGWIRVFGRRVRLFLLVMAAINIGHNAVCLASYI
jgi:hypothetical protein